MTQKRSLLHAIEIKKLIDLGYSTDDIIFITELNKGQIEYALNANFSHEEVEQLECKMEKNQTMKTLILIDTSIIKVHKMIEKLKELDDVIFVFTTIVIEELEGLKQSENIAGEQRHNIKQLLRLAIESNSKIICSPEMANLPGWRIENKDARIIRTAFDLNNSKDVIVYTSDITFAAMAKSLLIMFRFFDVPEDDYAEVIYVPNQSNILGEILKSTENFDKIEMGEVAERINFNALKNFYYRTSESQLPMYLRYSQNGILERLDARDYIEIGDVIFLVSEKCIKKFCVKRYCGDGNVRLLKCGWFKNPIKECDMEQIAKCICELN